jgi:outer membrane cobalamin receptor
MLPLLCWGQRDLITISGYISDGNSGENLIGAAIFIPGSGKGTTSNQYGFYSIQVPRGEVQVRFAFVGYAVHELELNAKRDSSLNVELFNLELDEVEVIEYLDQEISQETQMSKVELNMAELEKLPVFFGERDILKTAQLLPGIQSGTEGSSGLFVRGGSPDQNLILLDGVPLYNVNHLFGFFSVFNPDALSHVEIIKGGFPARYGGRLSSVIDVRMKEGNNKEFHGQAQIGLIASKITLEGPILSEKTSFIVSARRTYADVLARPIIRIAENGEIDGGYYFYDINAKINHRFNDDHRLFLSIYTGKDHAYFKEKYSDHDYAYIFENNLKWGNLSSALRWNWKLNPKLFSNLSLTYSQYKFHVGFYEKDELWDPEYTFEEYSFDYDSDIKDWNVKWDFDWIPDPDHYVRFGANTIFHRFNPGVNQFSESVDNEGEQYIFANDPIHSPEYYVYVEDDIRWNSRLKTNIGLHYSGFKAEHKTYHSLQPRLSARYLISDKLSVKASYARMTQYILLLSNAGIGLPSDLWLPATDKVPPMNADQVAAGFAYNWRDFEVSLEGYYKWMYNVIEYREGAFFSGGGGWEKQVVSGDGTAYGLEFLLRRKRGKLSGWIGYTLAWSWREFDKLNSGKRFPYRYDRRHDISIALSYEATEKWDFGLVWVYGTGKAVSLPIASFAGATDPLTGWTPFSNSYYQERNGFREPAYHRLDLSFNHHKSFQNGNSRVLSFGVYNVYNRQNPFFLYFEDDYYTGERKLYQISLFPILPYISYSLKF